VTQPLKWYGGKSKLAHQIVSLMPKHTRYLEAYAGGLSVLLNKPCEGIAEFANDTNGDLINFWNVLSNVEAFYRFNRIVQCIPLSEECFDYYMNSNMQDTGSHLDYSVKRAVRFFVRMRMSRQGIGRDYCTPTSRLRRGMNENVSAWLTAVDGLPEIHARLRRVEVWERPAIEAIKRLDSEETLCYADPPYMADTRSSGGEYGVHEMSDDEHAELLTCLAGLKGKFILSGYHSEMYDRTAETYGWSLVEIDVANSASSAKSKQRKTECLWMNFVPEIGE
jgi:DNA adenine methylase